MKNNKGFTLVEIIAVIAILAIIVVIAVPVASNTKRNANIKLLETKIDNIRQAAVLYVQDCKNLPGCPSSNFQFKITNCDACKDDSGAQITNCFCAGTETSPGIWQVTYLEISDIKNANYIAADEGDNIINPVDKTKTLNNCNLILYKKYGKVYAIYDTEFKIKKGTTVPAEEKTRCWYE